MGLEIKGIKGSKQFDMSLKLQLLESDFLQQTQLLPQFLCLGTFGFYFDGTEA